MADPAYYLDINGLSKHFGDPDPRNNVDEYNERNLGLGVTRETVDNDLAKILTAGYFDNSFNDPTMYAAGGLAKQFGKDYYARLGGLAGVMTGYHNDISPMAAGLLTLGKKDLGRLNFMYAPGVGDKDPLLMMNLGIPIK